MKAGGRARLLAQPHEDDVPWDYFLLEAARGGTRVVDWLNGGICVVAARHAGVAVDVVDESHLQELLATLPATPDRWLDHLLSSFRLTVGTLGRPVVARDQVGTRLAPVPAHSLVHDAAVWMRRQYGPSRLDELLDALDTGEPWPVHAVEASLYVLLLDEGEPVQEEAPAPPPGRQSLWITPGD